ncbi:MAG: hypothetical protein RMJ17_01420 [Candidatus Aenigmarchaeota archaeon]|nr:hypothetical protein [Candidatus Aenigmarchaeota archaeon]MDW8149240.1 hypothetical protein [Candidatus Aenigmarchaeota archaeon]
MRRKRRISLFSRMISMLLVIVGFSLITVVVFLHSSTIEEIELKIKILSVIVGSLYIMFSLLIFKQQQ